jgi:hypothetical protein
MEKPTKVEVGQRWQPNYGTTPMTVDRPQDANSMDDGTRCFWFRRDDDTADSWASEKWLLASGYTFLGWAPGFGPQPGAPVYQPKPAIDNPPPQVMSAKSLIEHRADRLKRADPWRPSVDDWDLLPDA